MQYEIKYIWSARRRTYGLQINKPGELIVRLPARGTTAEANKYVASKEKWIQNSMDKLQQRAPKIVAPIDAEQVEKLATAALKAIPVMVKKYAKIMGVTYNGITIRNQKTRWGSCSSKGNLNFNCLLMLAPVPVQEYLVIHELAHRLEMNHSAQFWQIVRHYMPDYRVQEQWLKTEGSKLILGMKAAQEER